MGTIGPLEECHRETVMSSTNRLTERFSVRVSKTPETEWITPLHRKDNKVERKMKYRDYLSQIPDKYTKGILETFPGSLFINYFDVSLQTPSVLRFPKFVPSPLFLFPFGKTTLTVVKVGSTDSDGYFN